MLSLQAAKACGSFWLKCLLFNLAMYLLLHNYVRCAVLYQVVPTAPAELQTLPNLHILVVRHLCTVGHLLHVRWG